MWVWLLSENLIETNLVDWKQKRDGIFENMCPPPCWCGLLAANKRSTEPFMSLQDCSCRSRGMSKDWLVNREKAEPLIDVRSTAVQVDLLLKKRLYCRYSFWARSCLGFKHWCVVSRWALRRRSDLTSCFSSPWRCGQVLSENIQCTIISLLGWITSPRVINTWERRQWHAMECLKVT